MISFNICKHCTNRYFQGDLETISSCVCSDKKTNIFDWNLGDLSVFVVTKEGILTENMMMTNPNQLIKNRI